MKDSAVSGLAPFRTAVKHIEDVDIEANMYKGDKPLSGVDGVGCPRCGHVVREHPALLLYICPACSTVISMERNARLVAQRGG